MVANLEELEPVLVDQLALVTWDQMSSRGLSDRDVSGLLKRRVIERVRRGVYRLLGAPRSWEQTVLAAVLGAGDGALASHASAARLWEFRHYDEDVVEIVVPRRFAPHLSGARVHRTVWLPDNDVSSQCDVPCTSFERTLCDVTTQLAWFQAGRILDDGLRRGVASLDRLRECALQLDSGPNRRLTVIDGLIRQRSMDFEPGGSGEELNLLALLEAAGLPRPEQQFRVRVNGRTFFLDFAWPEFKVFAEWYGTPWHIGASAVMSDNARLTALSRARWRPMIFTEASSEKEIIDTVADMLEQVGCLTHQDGG